VAVVRLPFGETVFEEFDLASADAGAGKPKEILLSTLPGALRSHLAGPPPQQIVDWTSDLKPGWIGFNPFKNRLCWLDNGQTAGSFPKAVTFTGRDDGLGQFFALSVRRRPADAAPPRCYLVAVPASPYRKVQVHVVARSEPPSLTFRFERHTATMLLEYVKQGAVGSASRLCRVDEISAIELVDHKAEDPLAGALGLYVLLSWNALDQIGPRSEKMFEYNPWSADGVIIFAEHLARAGEHTRAREVLLDLEQRGLPVFSAGFRIALGLLDRYLRAGDDAFGPATGQAERLLDVLEDWARRVVFAEAITMLRVDPATEQRLRAIVPHG